MANKWKPTEEMWQAACNAGVSPKGLNVTAALIAAQPDIAAEALEEAAKVAESRHEFWNSGEQHNVSCDVTACADIAAAIRALIPKETAAQKPHGART